jgi:hypothetical protein
MAFQACIQPETYDVIQRKGAEHEFCMFYSRVVDCKFPSEDVFEKEAMDAFLSVAMKASPPGERFEKWKRLAKKWQDALRATKWPVEQS